MLRLKQTVLNYNMIISETISTITKELHGHFHDRLNSPFLENLGILLLSLRLLVTTIVLKAVIFILNLSFLIVQILTKLVELSMSIAVRVWIVLCILCHWVVDQKNTISTFKKWLISVWKKVGGSRQDYTSVSLETPGEHEAYEEQDNSGARLDDLRKKGII